MKRLLEYLFAKTIAAIRREAWSVGYQDAMKDFKEMLRAKDKVYIEPMTLVGGGNKIVNCGFIGSNPGILIQPSPELQA